MRYANFGRKKVIFSGVKEKGIRKEGIFSGSENNGPNGTNGPNRESSLWSKKENNEGDRENIIHILITY